MAIKTQGTELYAFDPVEKEILYVACVDTIDGLDEQIEQIETTCLSDLARTYEGGLATPQAVTFTIQFDPDNEDNIKLYNIKKSGRNLDWFIGFRYEENGAAVVPGPAPTYDSVEDEVTTPETRAWIVFNAYMANFPFAFNQNDVVRSAISAQVSGEILVIPKTPTP